MSSQTPRETLAMLDRRDGHRSAWTGEESDTLVPQHRIGGMGGSASKHRASNVVWLESDINGDIESNAEMQREAYRRGIKVSRFQDPAEVPIEHAVHGRVLLDDEGGWAPATTPDPYADWRDA
jgi:hypothetical protein